MNMRWLLPGKPGSGSLTLDRLNGLSDGVVAIVLTLLVLGVDVPPQHNFSQDGLLPFLMTEPTGGTDLAAGKQGDRAT